ncbi:MAG: hypothetical protein R2867_23390 [Caldilineaceae bacterium]
MSRFTMFALLSVVTALLLAGCAASPIVIVTAPGDTFQVTTSTVYTHRLRGEVKPVLGATAALVRTANTVTVVFTTADLVPGNIYTAWWMVANQPDACETSPCSVADIMSRADIVHSEVGIGDGQIADEMGQAEFRATLKVGDTLDNWFGYGLPDTSAAEIHVVLHDHGPPVEGLVEEMLNSFRAGCTDESLPTIFPALAYADGTPGPNACIHYQFAMFQP